MRADGGRKLSRLVLCAGWGSMVMGGVALASVAMASVSGAQSLPFCGGQNAPPQPVPYTCRTQTQTIDGSQVSAVLHADGTTVTVTYTLVAPRPTDAPIRITHHIGVSGAGGTRSSPNGVIPAGQTTATLSVTTPCFAGQVDIKFVFVLDTQPQGRVGGPWIENGTGCTVVTTTTSTTIPTTPPTTPATTTPTTTPTTPPTTPPTSPASTPPTAPPSSVSQRTVSTTLPVTGGGSDAYSVALVAVMIGSLLVVIGGARRVAAHRGES